MSRATEMVWHDINNTVGCARFKATLFSLSRVFIIFILLYIILQNTTDFISMNEALLVRFKTDDTIANKGFAAVFVAIDRQDSEENLGGEDDEDQENI